MDDIKKLEEELKEAELQLKSRKITSTRGRLIKKLKQEIAKLKKDPTEENQKLLKELEEKLSTNLSEHKDQLSGRYKEEYVEEAGSLLGLITVLPKGLALAAKKIGTCISQLKEAKTNKERAFNVYEALKSAGLLVATPAIYAGKFIVRHWFLSLLFVSYIFNIPGILFDKFKDTVIQKGKHDLTDNFIGKGYSAITGNRLPEDTTFGKELAKTFTDPEELKKIGKDGLERLKKLPSTIKNDIQSIKEGYTFIKDNIRKIKYIIKQIFGVNPDQITGEVKDKLNGLTERFANFNPKDPNALNELRSINTGLEEIKTSLLANGVEVSRSL